MLSRTIDFGPMDARQFEPEPQRLPPAPAANSRSGGGGDIRRGMSTDEVHDLLGVPTRSKPGKQGELSTLTEWYEAGDRVTEVTYVGGVVVKFSTSSK